MEAQYRRRSGPDMPVFCASVVLQLQKGSGDGIAEELLSLQ
jgi:hypothetical protein